MKEYTQIQTPLRVCWFLVEADRQQSHQSLYRHESRQKVMSLDADEFIRRFLLHVLPSGFQRIRHYGFLANRCRADKLAHCRQLLAVSAPAAKLPDAAVDYRDRYQQLTGKLLRDCPICGQGHMICIETFRPGTLPRGPPAEYS